MALPRISAIASNFNGAKYLSKLIGTLESQVGVEVEIIVVDRHSIDESADILQRYANVKVISEPPESGLVSGYAAGAKLAANELLFFCNEDMWFDSQCLAKLAAHINLDVKICAADPWQWTYDGVEWIHGGVAFEKAVFDTNVPYPFRRHLNTVRVTEGTEVPFGCAGAILIHRKVYDEVGGWDTSFFLDHEDVDFFLRCWQRGWKCVSIPGSKVYHAVGASNSKVTSKGAVSKKRYISGRSSLMILGVKHFGFLYMPLPFLIVFAGMIKNIGFLRFQRLGWSLLAVINFCARMPVALRYRFESNAIRRSRRGEQFFTVQKFQRDQSTIG